MKRKQTIFARATKILWICVLACLYSVHAFETPLAHAAGMSHGNSHIANHYIAIEDCNKSKSAEHPSQQDTGKTECCLHCASANNTQNDHIIHSKSVAVIEILLPPTADSRRWMEETGATRLPKELFAALLATRGPPLFS